LSIEVVDDDQEDFLILKDAFAENHYKGELISCKSGDELFMTLSDAVDRLRGKIGSDVSITLFREGMEEPIEVINKDKAFIVLEREVDGQVCFYNRNAIIRLEYEHTTTSAEADLKIIPCQLTMMDGALFDGEIRESLAPDRARLFDYLNQDKARFIKLYIDNKQVCLVNKSYIVKVTTETSKSN